MTRRELLQKCSESSRLSPERCGEVLDLISQVIGRETGSGRHLMVDDFGLFQQCCPGRTPFRPARRLLERIASDQPPEHPQTEPDTKEQPETLPESILPVHNVAPEDLEIIERWLQSRGGDLDVTTDGPDASRASLPIRRVFRSPHTIDNAKNVVLAFCRRSPVPLRRVGLAGDSWEPANGAAAMLRREIVMYAQDYEQRVIRRLSPRRRQILAAVCRRSRRAYPFVLRTSGWRKFSTYARDLFAWMEEEGLRPPGTNPLSGMRPCSELRSPGANPAAVLHWCKIVLAYPRLTAQERALLFLLQNGLSPGEARSLRVSEIELPQGICTVGTGYTCRNVRLARQTIAAVRSWLQLRTSVSEWLFPGVNKNKALSADAVERMVRRVCKRVFPAPEQENIAKAIRPRDFRCCGVATASDPLAMAAAVGVSYQWAMRYIVVDDKRRDREFGKFALRRPF